MTGKRSTTAASMRPLPGSVYEEPKQAGFTLLIVVFSLLFVMVFGGALVGGIVSGDAHNIFFSIIIVCSAVGLGLASIAGTIYICRMSKREREKGGDIQGTFAQSDDDQFYQEDPEYDAGYPLDRYELRDTPVEARIKEIKATRDVGDMSALSPNTHEMDHYSDVRHIRKYADRQHSRRHGGRSGRRTPGRDRSGGRGLFDFSSIASSRQGRAMPRREDPPESFDEPFYNHEFPSRDPDGHLVHVDENADLESVANEMKDEASSSPSTRSKHSSSTRYEVEVDDEENQINPSNSTESDVDDLVEEGRKSPEKEARKVRFVF